MAVKTYIERYVTTTGAGAHTGVNEDNAWDLEEAAATANAPDGVNMRVNVKDDGVYAVPPTDGLAIAGSGLWNKNSELVWRGYHLTIGDMDPGGDFYQSAFARYLAGSEMANSKVHINAPNAVGSTFVLSAPAENLTFENFTFTARTSGQYCIKQWAALGGGGVVRNCFATAGTYFVEPSGDGEGVFQMYNYCTGGVRMRTGWGDLFGCIVEGGGGISVLRAGSCHHCIVHVGGNNAFGIGVSYATTTYNNLIVGGWTTAIESDGPTPNMTEFNNIMVLALTNRYAVVNHATGGGAIQTDYSLAYCTAGDFDENLPWFDDYNDVDIMGPNSIRNVDPKLTMVNGKYAGLDSDSPCWFAGKLLQDSGRAHIGPFAPLLDELGEGGGGGGGTTIAINQLFTFQRGRL